jgi:tetratricopeptide (TPR) repeat protein
LLTLGHLRLNRGDAEGFAEIRHAVRIAEEANLRNELQRCYGNLADAIAGYLGDLEQCFAYQAKGARVAVELGVRFFVSFYAVEHVTELYHRGRWADALTEIETLLPSLAESGHFMEIACRISEGRIRLARGELERAQSEATAALERARAVGDPQVLHPTLALAGLTYLALGRREEANRLAREYLEQQRAEIERTGEYFAQWDAKLSVCWLCRDCGLGDELGRLTAHATPARPWDEVVAAILEGELAAAADRLAEFGSRAEEGYARLRAAEQLALDGRRHEADAQLTQALAFYRSVGAKRYIRQGEALLAATEATA